MKIKLLEIAGLRAALMALRLPFGKECRSKTDFVVTEPNQKQFGHSSLIVFDPEGKDLKLMSTLVKRGDEHAKVVRGIVVYAAITAPVYFWAELETYRAGHERLCSESTMHIDCKGLSEEELVKAKSKIPMGKELTKIDMFSYQCLRNIYRQRITHRLPEWIEFCHWIESLPYAKELIIPDYD